MNIEKAKGLPLSVILEKMGLTPQKETKEKVCYFSPFRAEKTASFFVYTKTNTWFDFGDKRGGDVIDLVRIYLEGNGVLSDTSSALRWLKNMTAWQRITPVTEDDCYEGICKGSDDTLVFKNAEPVEKQGLIHYGEKRGIAPYVTKKYLEQVTFVNKSTGKKIFALGMKNESKGYDLRNPQFKGCIRQKDVTFIRGKNIPQLTVNVFEGMMDFLTVITQRNGKPLDDDSIILHSLSCMDRGTAYIRNYTYETCNTWFDNDSTGQKATESWEAFCQSESIKHVSMNDAYKPYKDVNAAHMAKLELA